MGKWITTNKVLMADLIANTKRFSEVNDHLPPETTIKVSYVLHLWSIFGTPNF